MQLLNWSFDWKYMVRGLVLDKKRGNILKVNSVHLFFCFCTLSCLNLMDNLLELFVVCIIQMDRHKYVKVAYHGFKELSKEEKVGTYGNTLVRDAFDEPDYALIDTLFSLAEAYLFAQLVDFHDRNLGKVPE
jgi:hypothetical protein